MARLEIHMPDKYLFSHEMVIRKTDISKDLHVSFATIMDLVFEGHLRFFKYLGYDIQDVDGLGLIFADASVVYRGELLADDHVKIEVSANQFFDKGCDLFFHLTKNSGRELVADVKIRMLFFNYSVRKVAQVPAEFKDRVSKLLGESVSHYSEAQASRHTESPLWNSAHQFVIEIYKITANYPQIEKDQLVSRMRKAATSLPLSIVEAGRKRDKSEILKAFGKTRGYLEELRYYLILSSDLGLYDTEETLKSLDSIVETIKKTLKPIQDME